jgi:hypothetical protein
MRGRRHNEAAGPAAASSMKGRRRGFFACSAKGVKDSRRPQRGNYSTITGASPAITTRDLADLTEKGALIRSGERKHARYTLNF